MESVTEAKLRSFLQRLGERYTGSGSLYLLGGCALCLLDLVFSNRTLFHLKNSVQARQEVT